MGVTVIICAGAPHPALELIPTYLDSADQVYFIGVDRGAYHLMQQGYPVDWAMGDFDSVTASEYEELQAYCQQIERVSSHKDDTDLELALAYVSQMPNMTACYIFGALGSSGGRLDHLILNLWLAHQPRFSSLIPRCLMIESDTVVQFFNPGVYQIQPGTNPQYLSIITMSPVKGLKIKQAVYNLSPTDLDYPKAYISNEFIDTSTPIQLEFHSGMVCVMWVKECEN